jgi:large subunit ribosomal protein L18e
MEGNVIYILKDNVTRLRLAHQLAKHSKKTKQQIWKVASRKIEGPRRNRSLVNVGEISRNTKEGSKVMVAGKVLGAGEIDHKVTVGAYSFSGGARSKILESGGKCLNLEDFMEENKSVKNVEILG